MSTVTLFVDDAVQGHVPMVCVVTGAPADGIHRVEQSIGPPAWIFVLLLLGPIGWIALIALQASSRSLTVRLPKTVAAVDRETRAFRLAILGAAAMCGGGMGWIALAGHSPHSPVSEVALVATAAVAVAGAISALCFVASYLATRVGVSLDASGRWVTLRNVHPAFAAAVAAAPSHPTGVAGRR